MLGDLITLPIRLSAQAATLALRTTERIAGGVLDLAGRVMQGAGSSTESPRPHRDQSESPATPRRSASTEASQNGGGARPGDDEPDRATTGGGSTAVEDEEPLPVEPVVRQPSTGDAEPSAAADPAPEPAHVSEDAELVEEFAEPGAEDGAGAQIRVAEPWPGYAELNARDVIDRLAAASAAELTAVNLYESTHQARKSVLEAAQRQLQAQSANTEEARRNDTDG